MSGIIYRKSDTSGMGGGRAAGASGVKSKYRTEYECMISYPGDTFTAYELASYGGTDIKGAAMTYFHANDMIEKAPRSADRGRGSRSCTVWRITGRYRMLLERLAEKEAGD